MIRSCISDQSCKGFVEAGQSALLCHQEQQSREGSTTGGAASLGSESAEEEEEDSDEEEVRKGLARCGLGVKDRPGGGRPGGASFPVLAGGRPPPTAPTAWSPSYGLNPPGGGRSFCTAAWREWRTESAASAFPVFTDAGMGQRFHEPLELKTIKMLAEAVQTYGINASFTVAILESLSRQALTPADWAGLIKACVPSGKYLMESF